MEDERLADSYRDRDRDRGMDPDRAAGNAKTKRTVDDILNAFRSATGSATDRSGGGAS